MALSKHFKRSTLAQKKFELHTWVKKCHFGNFSQMAGMAVPCQCSPPFWPIENGRKWLHQLLQIQIEIQAVCSRQYIQCIEYLVIYKLYETGPVDRCKMRRKSDCSGLMAFQAQQRQKQQQQPQHLVISKNIKIIKL